MRWNHEQASTRKIRLLDRVTGFLWRWSYQRNARLGHLAVVQVWQRQ